MPSQENLTELAEFAAALNRWPGLDEKRCQVVLLSIWYRQHGVKFCTNYIHAVDICFLSFLKGEFFGTSRKMLAPFWCGKWKIMCLRKTSRFFAPANVLALGPREVIYFKCFQLPVFHCAHSHSLAISRKYKAAQWICQSCWQLRKLELCHFNAWGIRMLASSSCHLSSWITRTGFNLLDNTIMPAAWTGTHFFPQIMEIVVCATNKAMTLRINR